MCEGGGVDGGGHGERKEGGRVEGLEEAEGDPSAKKKVSRVVRICLDGMRTSQCI